jgi:3-phenylpropionate/trans-cinnamate dioxygenase ferredoxin reductase component
MSGPIVIVGASLTGGTAAHTLRDKGFDGEIILIGAEKHLPYERPPLSKDYMRGEQPFEKSLVKPADYWTENKIQLRLGERVEGVDTASREVVLAGGERIGYDKVLIATGVRNRKLNAPGVELPGVHSLRTLEESDAIRADAANATRAVVVGMGFIGAEVAASLRTLGLDVTAVEPTPTPLHRVLGSEVGGAIGALHADHGVHMRFEDVVESFEGSSRVETVVTKSGERLPADIVVVGVGVEPVTDPVAGTDIEIDNGILVDERCRTNVEGVYAAGDIANHQHPLYGRRMRVEHWQNAMRHGAHAAKSMLGSDEAYAEVHWFWSDQYEANIQYAGHHREWDSLVIRGSIPERSFVAFYIKAGLVDGIAALDRGKELRRAMGIIKARRPVEEKALRDEGVDLKSIAG